MADITKAMSIENGLSLDDNIGVFHSSERPDQGSGLGPTSQVPLGSLVLLSDGVVNTNIFQRYTADPNGYRRVFFANESPIWSDKLINMFWLTGNTAQKNDYLTFSPGATISSETGYLFPFPITIRNIILSYVSMSSGSQQSILLAPIGVPRTLLHRFISGGSTTFTQTGLSIVVPGLTKVRLQLGTNLGVNTTNPLDTATLRSVVCNILAEGQPM